VPFPRLTGKLAAAGVVPVLTRARAAPLERSAAVRLALWLHERDAELTSARWNGRTLMKTALFAGGLVALAFAAPAAAQEAKQDFTLVNKTGYALNEAYLAPADTNEWQEDFLGKDQLDDGDTKKVHFSPKAKTCKWDLQVVYTEDNSKVVWRNIDLCTVDRITIFYNRKNDTTSAKFD
jgi:hypothetical protein